MEVHTKVNWLVLWVRGCEEVDLIHHVNKHLCIIPTETSDNLDLVAVGDNGCYERGALMHGNGVANQPFPGRGVAAHDHSQTNGCMIAKMAGELTR